MCELSVLFFECALFPLIFLSVPVGIFQIWLDECHIYLSGMLQRLLGTLLEEGARIVMDHDEVVNFEFRACLKVCPHD